MITTVKTPVKAVIATVAGDATYFSTPIADSLRIELLFTVVIKRRVSAIIIWLLPKQGPQLDPNIEAPDFTNRSIIPS